MDGTYKVRFKMTKENETEMNFNKNEMLDLYDQSFSVAALDWFDPDFFQERLSLASADSTIHIVRIYLKMFALWMVRNRRNPFTRSLQYPMDNRLAIAKTLVENGFKLCGEHLDDHVFAKNDIVVSLFDNGYINAFSYDPRRNEETFKLLNEHFHVTEEIKNRAYILRQTGGGFDFTPYEVQMRELVSENYMPEVVEQLPRLYAVVNNEEPFGRLAVLEGRPGGGKTSLIRGMMNEFGRPKFVIVPPYLVTHLSSPSMIDSLIREQSNDPRPLVLVLEDADECLTKRAGDNMANISAVLNLSEGILSDTLDIRLVATTNAKRTDLDDALIRPGRLGCYIRVPALSSEQAAKVLSRLTDKSYDDSLSIIRKGEFGEGDNKISFAGTDGLTLGSMYAVAAQLNGTHVQVRVPSPERRKVGF